jgi:hypothetical protein
LPRSASEPCSVKLLRNRGPDILYFADLTRPCSQTI